MRGRRNFAALARTRRRARSGPVRVHFVPAGAESGPVQVAYAVGRAVGTAVVRNRWRRRLRVLAAEVAPELPPGMYLVGLGPDVTELSFDQLRERVTEAMRTASGRTASGRAR